jgi:hypothetical protein
MISEKSEQAYFDYMRPKMAQFLPSEYSKILEIGCNVGNFHQLCSKPCEYWGIEPLKELWKLPKQKSEILSIGDKK